MLDQMWFFVTLGNVARVRVRMCSFLQLSFRKRKILPVGEWVKKSYVIGMWHWLHCRWNTCWLYFIITHFANLSDQLDTQLLYFTIRLLWSSTCFEHYMLIIRRLSLLMQHLVSSLSASGCLVNLCTGQPLTESDDTRCCIDTIQTPDDEHIMLETCTVS